MDKTSAIRLIQETFQDSFKEDRFFNFANNLLNHIKPTPSTVYRGNLIPDAYKPYIQSDETQIKEIKEKQSKLQKEFIDLYGVALQVEKVKEKVLSLSGDRKKKEIKGQVALTERQMRIVERINTHGGIANRDVRGMFKLSDEGALKEIRKLVKLGVLKSEGKGRSVRYLLA